ncbi:MAG: YgiQ family radical SAM protein, partial [Nitrospinota bacterium]|nr:YgiQ family radical SAM protein [Nitrospinota bacterium]
MKSKTLPMTMAEMNAMGWDQLDVILVTGDSYVDHPSFGAAIVGRYLQSLGLRVGVIAAPDPDNMEDFTRLGAPTMFFGVTAGAMDSMVMLRTAQKKHRSDDAYAEGGMAGRRPARAVMVYCNRIRAAFKGASIVIGGMEASLRRFSHYDFWDDKVRRSILQDSKADMLVYGMGERPLAGIVAEMRAGKSVKQIRDIRGTAVMINMDERKELGAIAQTIPSFEEVSTDKAKYARASRMIHMNQNPGCAKTLVQKHGGRYIRVNPPAEALTTGELDAIYALPFTRAPHSSYKGKIPAWEMI